MATAARILSILFHPVFVPAMVFAILIYVCPEALFGVNPKTQQWWLITISYITITFPLLTVILLWRLKFIESIHMHELKERYGPLIASMMFYFWVFWLFHKQFQAPIIVQSMLLGIFLTTVMVFMASIFFKISMHTAAWGCVAAISVICGLLGISGSVWFIVFAFIMAGLIGSARVYLKAHIMPQIWSGYVVGILSQIIAYFVIKII